MKKIALLLAIGLCLMLISSSALASWAALSKDEILDINVKSESIVVVTVKSAKVYTFMSNGQMVSMNTSTDGDLKEITLNVQSSIYGKIIPTDLKLWFCSELKAGSSAVLGIKKLDKAARADIKKNLGYDPGEYGVNFQYLINEIGEVMTPNDVTFSSLAEYISGVKEAAKYVDVKAIDFKEQTYTAQLYYDSKIYVSPDTKSNVLLQGKVGDLLTMYGSTVTKNKIQWTKVLLKDYTTAYVQTSNISKYRYTVPEGTQFARVTKRTPVYSRGMLIGYACQDTLLPTIQKINLFDKSTSYYIGIPNFRAEIPGEVLSFENGNTPFKVLEKEEPMETIEVEDTPSHGPVDPTITTKLYTSDFYHSLALQDEKLAISEQNHIIQTMGYPRTIAINDTDVVTFYKNGPILFFRSGNKIVYYQGYNILSQHEMRKQFGNAFYTRMSPESIAANKLAVAHSYEGDTQKPPYENVYWLSNNERYIVFVYKTEADANKGRKELLSARATGNMFIFVLESGNEGELASETAVGKDTTVYQKGKSLICYFDDITPRGETYSEIRKQTNLYLARLYGKQY